MFLDNSKDRSAPQIRLPVGAAFFARSSVRSGPLRRPRALRGGRLPREEPRLDAAGGGCSDAHLRSGARSGSLQPIGYCTIGHSTLYRTNVLRHHSALIRRRKFAYSQLMCCAVLSRCRAHRLVWRDAVCCGPVARTSIDRSEQYVRKYFERLLDQCVNCDSDHTDECASGNDSLQQGIYSYTQYMPNF